MVRGARGLAALVLVGCTSAAPARFAADDLPPREPVVPVPVSAADPPELLVPMHPLDDHRLLVLRRGAREELSIRTYPSEHVWSYMFEPGESVPDLDTLVTVEGALVAPLALDNRYAGAVGLDLTGGALLWRHETAAADPIDLNVLYAGLVGDLVVHVVSATDHALIARTAAGEPRLQTRLRWPSAHLRTEPRFGAHGLLHFAPDPATPPADPDLAGDTWIVRRGPDLAPAYTLTAHARVPPCVVGDHVYSAGEGGLTRLRLDRPDLVPESLDPDPVPPVACDRHRDADVIWRRGHVLGVLDDGTVAWRIDLRGWWFERWFLGATALPDHPVLWAVHPVHGRGLLFFDLARPRLAAVVPLTGFTGDVFRNERVSVVGLAREGRFGLDLLFAVDGATGALTGAVFVDGAELEPTLRDRTLWLTDSRPPTRVARLDALTLRELDGGSPVPLRDATAWVAARLPGADAPLPPDVPPPPPRRPASEQRDPSRAASPEPPWDRAPLDAAVRAVVSAADDRPVQLLAWAVRRREDQAVVALEYGDHEPRWLLALMQRETPDQPWTVDRGVHWPRRYLLSHRPTSAQIERLVDNTSRWSFEGHDDAYPIVAANVVDTTWLAVTGEPPRRFYPPGLEHPE